METGVVLFFDSRDNKRFGFLRLESREEVFFHLDDGRTVEAGEDVPRFAPNGIDRIPKRGDRVVFERLFSWKSPRACPWAFADELERASVAKPETGREGSFRVDGVTMTYEWVEPDGSKAACVLKPSYTAACGVFCPEFSRTVARGNFSSGMSELVDSDTKLAEALRHALPAEMERALRQRFTLYREAIDRRRPQLLALLREVTGDPDAEMDEGYEFNCASLFELQFQTEDSDEMRAIYEKMYRSGILERYWEPKTPPERLRFYPGGASAGGFLGWGEALEAVIDEDAQRLAALGCDHQAVGLALKEVLDGLSARHEVETVGWLGSQPCPFAGCEYETAVCPHNSIDFRITNRASGDVVSGPGLAWHLIAVHRFFEGKGSPYRVDPEQLVKALFSR